MHLSMYRCIFFYTFVYMEPICVNAYGNCLWMHVSKLTSLNDMDCRGLVPHALFFGQVHATAVFFFFLFIFPVSNVGKFSLSGNSSRTDEDKKAERCIYH